MLLRIFLLISTITTVCSCSGTTHKLASGNFSKSTAYEINDYYGCCGCEAKYFTIKSGKQKMEQIIYSYNCGSIGKPTKFIFNYDENGQLISCDKYIATTTNDFTLILSEQERQLFSVLDSSAVLRPKHTTISFSEITGFRKPIDSEISHSFPLVKRGNKLVVN